MEKITFGHKSDLQSLLILKIGSSRYLYSFFNKLAQITLLKYHPMKINKSLFYPDVIFCSTFKKVI